MNVTASAKMTRPHVGVTSHARASPVLNWLGTGKMASELHPFLTNMCVTSLNGLFTDVKNYVQIVAGNRG